jgi:hypothetical protein
MCVCLFAAVPITINHSSLSKRTHSSVCLLLQYLLQEIKGAPSGTREEPGTLTQGAPVFPGSSRLGIEPKTPGWLVQDPTTSPSGDRIPTIRGSERRLEPKKKPRPVCSSPRMCSLPAEAHRGETHESHIALMLFCSACEHEPLSP